MAPHGRTVAGLACKNSPSSAHTHTHTGTLAHTLTYTHLEGQRCSTQGWAHALPGFFVTTKVCGGRWGASQGQGSSVCKVRQKAFGISMPHDISQQPRFNRIACIFLGRFLFLFTFRKSSHTDSVPRAPSFAARLQHSIPLTRSRPSRDPRRHLLPSSFPSGALWCQAGAEKYRAES